MDERKLKTFLAVVRTGSFNKAAAQMNFSQSAVSQMMNSFESELGCKLLERGHSGIELTGSGKALLPQIEQAEHALSQLKNHARHLADEEPDCIRIGTFSSISNTWLPTILSSYQKLHPKVTFEIKIGFLQIAEWLSKGEIDLALGDKERCRSDNWKPLFHEPYYAVLPSDLTDTGRDSISQKELAEYPLVITPSSVLLSRLQVISPRQVNVTGDDDSTLVAMVAQGLGTAIMPRSCLLNAPEQVRILKLVPELERTIGIALAESPEKSVTDFYRYLREHHRNL